MSFTVSTGGGGGPPGKATLVSPSGTINDSTPTYTWNAVSGSTWYYLWVNESGTPVIKKWYRASSVCSGSTCSVTPSTTLSDGDHAWWIRTWNDSGNGPWSSKISFTVSTGGGGGFSSQFNGDASGWETHYGTWWIDHSKWYTTNGVYDAFASSSYMADYTNFDYQARLWRSGCDDCANAILIRGTPEPLGDKETWHSAYAFEYNRYGYFSVWVNDGSGWNTLQEWTSSSAIRQGNAWNTLRVVANGSNLYFYINGTLVWSGSDTSLSSGRVGIWMYSDGTSGDQLWVDWATLTEISAGHVVNDTVSAEQQALNEAANQQKGGTPERCIVSDR